MAAHEARLKLRRRRPFRSSMASFAEVLEQELVAHGRGRTHAPPRSVAFADMLRRVEIDTTPACLRRLGLSLPFSESELKRAFRRRVLASHPDRGGSHEAFLALQRDYADAAALVTKST